VAAMAVVKHSDHAPELICRPAGNGLCEPLSAEAAAAVERGESVDRGSFTQYAEDDYGVVS
jgi:hypothetical protein